MNDETVHVVAVSGSLREESYTRPALRHALDGAESASASTELIGLRELDIPLFDADDNEAAMRQNSDVAFEKPTSSS